MNNNPVYKKALCDSDFDGCVCAAILKDVYPEIELHFTDPGSVQSGRYRKWADKETIIADLPYVEGVGLYFDHHLGNKPDKEIEGCWRPTNCAAEILLDYYSAQLERGKYEDLVKRLGDFDSGIVVIDDIQNPDDYMRMGFAIDRKDSDFHMFFACYLAEHSWQELLQQQRTIDKLAAEEVEKEQYAKFAREHCEVEDDIVFLDMKDFQGAGGHSFYVAMLYPDTKGIVIVKQDNDKVKFHLFHNIFNPKDGKSVNFLEIARKINPEESGGHKGACGCTLPKGMKIATARALVLKMAK